MGKPHLETYNGKTQSLTEWARELGIDRRVIWRRMADGYVFAEAIQPHARGRRPYRLGVPVVQDYVMCVELQIAYRRHEPASPWNREDIVQLGKLWMQTYGRPPRSMDCHPSLCLPLPRQIILKFGSLHNFVQAILRSDDIHDVEEETTLVTCLACDTHFASPDKRRVRLCPDCKERLANMDTADMSWMNGDVPGKAAYAHHWEV